MHVREGKRAGVGEHASGIYERGHLNVNAARERTEGEDLVAQFQRGRVAVFVGIAARAVTAQRLLAPQHAALPAERVQCPEGGVVIAQEVAQRHVCREYRIGEHRPEHAPVEARLLVELLVEERIPGGHPRVGDPLHSVTRDGQVITRVVGQ